MTHLGHPSERHPRGVDDPDYHAARVSNAQRAQRTAESDWDDGSNPERVRETRDTLRLITDDDERCYLCRPPHHCNGDGCVCTCHREDGAA